MLKTVGRISNSNPDDLSYLVDASSVFFKRNIRQGI